MNKNIILSSLSESFYQIWKNKSWLLVLIFLQIGFFAAIFAISSIYFPRILENAQAMSNYISTQNFDETAMTERVLQQKDILGDDPMALTRYFNGIVENFRMYLANIFISVLVFSSILWSITHKIVHKLNFRQFIRNFYKVFAVLFFYIGMIFLFFYLLLNISFSEAVMQGAKIFTKYIPLLIFSIALAYFMFVSLALANTIQINQLVQKTLTIGIKKAHYVLAAYFINIFLFILFVFLMAYFIDKNFFVVILALILFVFGFVFARVFIINVVNKLEEM